MTRQRPEQLHVQLVAMDHECLFNVVLYAYAKALKGADRSMLHRGVLSLDYKPDSDEVNRLRRQQAGLRDVDADPRLIDDLEALIELEHGRGRTAANLAALPLREVRDAGIDAVVGTGPDAEETATWLEADFETLTGRYEFAAAKGLGLHYRYS